MKKGINFSNFYSGVEGLYKWFLPSFLSLLLFEANVNKLHAQVFTENLMVNPAQFEKKRIADREKSTRDYLQKVTTADTLPLPFFDDFSRSDLVFTPTSNYFSFPINTIHFFGDRHARAFGENRLQIKTLNRGSYWGALNVVGHDISILSSSFDSQGSGFACGRNGWLAFTSDTGNTWQQKPSPADNPNLTLTHISFRNPQLGFVFDSLGKGYRTTDGGNVWSGITASGFARFRFRSASWINNTVAVAAGDSGRIARTADGGLTWNVQFFRADSAKNFRFAHMIDAVLGFICGDSGVIYKTRNGGLTWYKTRTQTFQKINAIAFHPSNKNIGWAIGNQGLLLYTQDEGNNWTAVRSGVQEDLLSIALVNEFRGWIGTRVGRLLHIAYDPAKPESRNWLPNSGVFINNTMCLDPITMGVATFDGLNADGIPYRKEGNFTGACDTLTSVPIDLSGLAGLPIHLSFWYQIGGKVAQLVPDETDSLVVQFKASDGSWLSVWNVKGDESRFPVPFKYKAIPVPDALKYSGFQFRFINFGAQTGNFDIWHIDYVRLNAEQTPTDSLARDFAISKVPGRILKGYSALPLEQFRYCLQQNVPIFEEKVSGEALNLNPGPSLTPVNGFFYVNKETKEGTTPLLQLPNDVIDGLQNPLGGGIFRAPIRTDVSAPIVSSLAAIQEYATLTYGFGLNQSATTNLVTQNDTLLGRCNFSTVMAHDDGSAELIRGVGGNFAKGAVKFYLPVTDTLTDIALHFPRTPFTFNQIINFTLILFDSINAETNFERPIFRFPVILPPADSLNKFDVFNLRIRPLAQRILKGGKHFFIGWQQASIDNSNEVRLGCDINSSNPGVFYYNSQGEWRIWTFDDYPLMIRPVFGPEVPVSVRPQQSSIHNQFFPNPARNQITSNGHFFHLNVINALGQVVHSYESGSPMETIKLDLNPGLYFLVWMDEKGQWLNQKLLLEK